MVRDLVSNQVFMVAKEVRERLVITTTPRVNIGQMTPTILALGITSSINISTPATTLATTLVWINVITMMVKISNFFTPRNFTSEVVRKGSARNKMMMMSSVPTTSVDITPTPVMTSPMFKEVVNVTEEPVLESEES